MILTLNFITQTSLVSYAHLHSALSAHFRGKKKKGQPQIHSQGAHYLHFSTQVNTNLE